MKKQIIYMLCATALLSSCHIYKSYDRPEDILTAGLYRDTVATGDTLASDTANFGNLPWREVFTDPQLQTLIEQGLANNTDLQTAILKVEEAKNALMTSRLAYAPSLALSPQGTISSFDKSAATKTYSLPVTASWEIDLFGKLLNAKRGAQATLLQTKAYRQAVQTQIIAGIANTYYTLLMLDRQMDISEQTADIMKRNVETMRAMKDAAMTNAAAVSQMASGPVTSFSQDVVTSNSVGGVETAVVMVDEQTTYDNFKVTDITSKADFEKKANVIGTTWRTPAMPGVTNAGVKTDRFYVLKDSYGNYYKLRFTKFGTGTDGTERGRPEIEYALLK